MRKGSLQAICRIFNVEKIYFFPDVVFLLFMYETSVDFVVFLIEIVLITIKNVPSLMNLCIHNHMRSMNFLRLKWKQREGGLVNGNDPKIALRY